VRHLAQANQCDRGGGAPETARARGRGVKDSIAATEVRDESMQKNLYKQKMWKEPKSNSRASDKTRTKSSGPLKKRAVQIFKTVKEGTRKNQLHSERYRLDINQQQQCKQDSSGEREFPPNFCIREGEENKGSRTGSNKLPPG